MAKRPNPDHEDYPPAKRPAMVEQAPLDLPADVNEVRDYLCTKYKKATVLLGFGVSAAGDERAIENVFVNLAMVKGSELGSEFRDVAGHGSSADLERVEHVYSRAARTMQPIDLGDLFNVDMAAELAGGRTSTRILVLASGGCGKTMIFLKHAPRLWAMGKLWPQFTILVSREFRSPAVQGAKDAIDLLGLGVYVEEDIECRRALKRYILNNPEKVCLILDGLDETSLSDCTSFVGDVVRGKELEGINLVVTSRPSLEVFALSSSKPFNSHIEVIGFQPEQVREYVNKVMTKEDKKTLVLCALDSGAQLESMMMTPFYACNVCELVEANYAIPRCTTDVFDSLMLRAVSRMRGNHFSSWDKVPMSDQELVNEIGSFAMHTLFRRKLIFSDTDIKDHQVSDAAQKLGLLVQCEVSREDPSAQFRFSHLALQESLASRFVASCDYMSTEMLSWMVKQLGADSGHLTTFWTLLAAQIDDAKMEALIASLLLMARENAPKDGVDAVADQFSTSPKKLTEMRKFLLQFLSRPEMEELSLQLLGGLVEGDPTKAVKSRMSQHPDTPLEDFLKELLSYWRQLTPRANASMLSAALGEVNQATERRFSDKFLPRLSLKAKTKARVAMASSTATDERLPHVKKMNLYFQRTRDVLLLAIRCFAERALRYAEKCKPVKGLAAALKAHGLNVSGCRCSPLDCRALVKVLEFHNSSVHTLRLKGCALGDKGIRLLQDGLLSCHRLQEMDWTNNKLTAGSMSILVEVMRNSCDALEDINVGGNRIGTSGINQLQQGAASCSKLRKLGFSGCGTQGGTDPVVLFAFPSSTLEEYDLSRSKMSAPVISAVLDSLATSTNLRKLNLARCSLEVNHMPTLKDVLAACSSTLQELDMDSTALDDEGFEQLCSGLALCTKLKKLRMNNCNLTVKSATVLSDIMATCPHLRHESVFDTQSDDGSRCMVRLALALLSPPHTMKELDLYGCGLTSDWCGVLNNVLHLQCDSLTELSLWQNSIDDAALHDIRESLFKCTGMVRFNMDSNDLTVSSLPVITALLHYWRGLRFLSLHSQRKSDTTSEVPMEEQQDFIDALARCNQLRILYIPRHWVQHGGVELPRLRRDGLKVDLGDH